MERRELRIGRLHGPCELGLRAMGVQIAHGGEEVHHVAERGELHQQDARRGHGAF
jgi:hypothetical protein